MIDLHTHILPNLDDGAKTPEDSVKMLRMEREQGIDTVVLTPHFYRYKERPEWFLERRMKSVLELREFMLNLPDEELANLPKLVLGCEVAWVPNLADLDCLPNLCIGRTKNMLLELPFTPWSKVLSSQIYDLMGKTGITPVIAHLERYFKIQPKEQIEEILSLGVPVQISADAFLKLLTRKNSLNALERWAHIVASDCHDPIKRTPCLGTAMAVVKKKLGEAAVNEIDRCTRELIEIRQG